MKYSIVMPVYNVQTYLKDSVADIKNQSFSDWELILVDDCATDLSGKLCDELADSDERIQVLHLAKNGGLSNARNQGMAVAQGDYILFLDPEEKQQAISSVFFLKTLITRQMADFMQS